MRQTWWNLAMLAGLAVFCVPATAPAAVDVIQGSPILTVLPIDAIPAIDHPAYVSVAEAERFLRPDEPVLGLSDGTTAKVYSAWQFNHHEIVNDTMATVRSPSRGDPSATRASCMPDRRSMGSS